MKRYNSLDPLDKNILRILSLYESLDLWQLWYEIGEDDATAESMTQEEVFSRLESLRGRGFVKRIKEPPEAVKWALKRREVDR